MDWNRLLSAYCFSRSFRNRHYPGNGSAYLSGGSNGLRHMEKGCTVRRVINAGVRTDMVALIENDVASPAHGFCRVPHRRYRGHIDSYYVCGALTIGKRVGARWGGGSIYCCHSNSRRGSTGRWRPLQSWHLNRHCNRNARYHPPVPLEHIYPRVCVLPG